MLHWANRFSIFCMLDSNHYQNEQSYIESILAVGCRRSVTLQGHEAFHLLQQFYAQKPSWIFGHLGYNAGHIAYGKELKNAVDFGDGFFFEPDIIIKIKQENICLITENEIDAKNIFDTIDIIDTSQITDVNESLQISPAFSKQQYIESIQLLQNHIKRGDCYEINFCMPFIGTNVLINPLQTYLKLAEISPNPFGALYRLNDHYCICASPERFLKKTGNILISQPIKGTARRNLRDVQQDDVIKKNLLLSQKEKSENVMVVDLVRNDMSKVAVEGSVEVKELFGVYTFPQVHHMVSTIQCCLLDDITISNVLQACFPMGSMTGAPKKKVMELIALYETIPRGLFSGSIGYITPEADFDFNVVIRSIFYDKKQYLINFFAGSGITIYADGAAEYDECLAKAEAIIKALL